MTSGAPSATFSLGGRSLATTLTPAQAFLAALTAAGCSGIILADDLVAPLSAPGSIVSHGDLIRYDAASAAGTFLPMTGGPNGVPFMRADGISKTHYGGVAETVDTWCVIFRIPPGQTSWPSYGGIFGARSDSNSNSGLMEPGTGAFWSGGVPSSVRRNGQVLTSPLRDMSPITDWLIAVVTSRAPTATRLLQIAGTNGYLNPMDIVAIGKWATTPTSGQIAAVESAASTYTGIGIMRQYTVTLSATNAAGTGTQTLTITVNP